MAGLTHIITMTILEAEAICHEQGIFLRVATVLGETSGMTGERGWPDTQAFSMSSEDQELRMIIC